MKLRREAIEDLAGQIFRALKEAALIQPRVAATAIQAKIALTIHKNIEEEILIEEEARKIMDRYRSQIASGAVDPQKMYQMIKKQVAKERKFVL